MSNGKSGRALHALRLKIREHLLQAQQLMDKLDPHSVTSARLQHVIDDMDEAINSTEHAPWRDDSTP